MYEIKPLPFCSGEQTLVTTLDLKKEFVSFRPPYYRFLIIICMRKSREVCLLIVSKKPQLERSQILNMVKIQYTFSIAKSLQKTPLLLSDNSLSSWLTDCHLNIIVSIFKHLTTFTQTLNYNVINYSGFWVYKAIFLHSWPYSLFHYCQQK